VGNEPGTAPEREDGAGRLRWKASRGGQRGEAEVETRSLAGGGRDRLRDRLELREAVGRSLERELPEGRTPRVAARVEGMAEARNGSPLPEGLGDEARCVRGLFNAATNVRESPGAG